MTPEQRVRDYWEHVELSSGGRGKRRWWMVQSCAGGTFPLFGHRSPEAAWEWAARYTDQHEAECSALRHEIGNLRYAVVPLNPGDIIGGIYRGDKELFNCTLFRLQASLAEMQRGIKKGEEHD